MNPIIGISGVATSGKDTFGNLLIEELKIMGYAPRRFALADSLKRELAPFILKEYGIDIFNCTPEEKTLVRPLLVFHGEMKRLGSKGTYWLDVLDKEIEEAAASQRDIIPIITDIRYAFYPNDEFFWVKQKRHGLVIHVQRYMYAMGENFESEKYIIPPANEVEARHDGALRAQADYKLSWQTYPAGPKPPNKTDVEEWCRPAVSEFRETPLFKDFLKRCYHPRGMT